MPNIPHLFKNSVSKMRRISELKRKEEGFTLIEVLAVATIFSILLTMACSLFMFQTNFYQYATTRADVQQNVRITADFITREVRYAEHLDPRSSEEIRYWMPGNADHYNIRRRPSDNNILRTPNIISYNIEKLDFDWDEDTKILIFTIIGSKDNYSYELKSAVYLPNHR